MKPLVLGLLSLLVATVTLACEPLNDNGGTSPIVINFDSRGYVLTGSNAPVEFDISATGQQWRIGWTAAEADEAFLALDRNGNGVIDNGAELFGNATPLKNGALARSGFHALHEFDDNHDGMINSSDGIWSQLLLWRDWNHDGLSQPWEITLVSASTLAAIDLAYHWTGRRDSFGNTFRYESRIVTANGRQRPAYDVYFVRVP
jgi:hypothetical protein